jgi:hypothetical protein
VNLATNTQLTESVALLEKAIALSPADSISHMCWLKCSYARKDHKAARLTLEQVIAGNPSPQMRVQAESGVEYSGNGRTKSTTAVKPSVLRTNHNTTSANRGRRVVDENRGELAIFASLASNYNADSIAALP